MKRFVSVIILLTLCIQMGGCLSDDRVPNAQSTPAISQLFLPSQTIFPTEEILPSSAVLVSPTLLLTPINQAPTLSATTESAWDFGRIDSNVCTSKILYNDTSAAARIAHQICLLPENSLNRSLCIPDYEINCMLHQPYAAAASSAEPLPQSLCSGMTVGGIGYARTGPQPYQLDAACLTSLDGLANRPIPCDVLGQTVVVDAAFCQQLTQCVEPQLVEQYGVIEQTDAGVRFAFDSSAEPLAIDLSCSDQALPTSLHHPAQGCRAIDINVEQNYGNLREESADFPRTTMPPELVSVMESCGIIWGGRYNGAENIPSGCDPMEFAFAPACFNP